MIQPAHTGLGDSCFPPVLTRVESEAFTQPVQTVMETEGHGNRPHQRENAYRYPTRLRKHAANANLPFAGALAGRQPAIKGVVD